MNLSVELASIAELLFVASCMVNGLAIATNTHFAPIKNWDAVQTHCWRVAERQRRKSAE